MPVLALQPILSEPLLAALQGQVVNEYNAAAWYRNAANWCRARAYEGSLDWLIAASRDEVDDAEGFLNFMTGLNEDASVPTVAAPATNYEDLSSLFRAAYDLEVTNTLALQTLSVLATNEGAVVVVEWLDHYLRGQRKSLKHLLKILNWFEGVDVGERTLEEVDHRIGKAA